jgi:predicted XRE-type DNA-binding protein
MGRTTRGMKNSRAKLTDADVVHIRTMAGTMLQREIAALFNVTSAFVSQIIRYKRRA